MTLPLSLRLQGDLSAHHMKSLKEYEPVDFVGFFLHCVSKLEQNKLGSQELDCNSVSF